MTLVASPDARTRSRGAGPRAVVGYWAAGGAAILIAWAAPAVRAQEFADPELHWEAPAGCPQQAAILSAVRRWLAQSIDPLDAHAVRVDARITPEAGSFALDLELESPSGQSREQLRAARCETFVDVVALKVTLASSPPGVPDDWDSESSPLGRPSAGAATHDTGQHSTRVLDADSAEPGSAARRSRAESDPADRERAAVGVGVRMVAGVGLGTLPGVVPNLAAAGLLRVSAFRFELGASYGFPSTIRYPNLPNTGAELQLLAGTAHVCFSPLQRPVELPLCAGIEVGVMRGQGFGVSEAFTSDQLWAAAVLAPALRVPLFGPVSGWIELQGLAALASSRYHVRTLDELYASERFSARAMAGLELALR